MARMDENKMNAWIANLACQALASLSSLYDDTGREAEAIMCDWAGDHSGAGETAARRVVMMITDLVDALEAKK